MTVDLAITPTPGGRMADSGPMAKPGYKGKQKLDPYVRQIARALMRKRGMSESHAIAVAKNATRKWARGGKKVRPQVRAGAAASVGNQARIDSLSNTGSDLIDLARGPLRYRHGWVKVDGGGTSNVTIMGRDVQAVGKAPRGGPAGYAVRNPGTLRTALAERKRRQLVGKARSIQAGRAGSAVVTYDGHDDYSDMKTGRAAKHRAKKAKPAGLRVATASLSNRGTVDVTADLSWSEALHPRDWRGRFGKKIGKAPSMTPDDHETYEAHIARMDKMLDHTSPLMAHATDVTFGAKHPDGSPVFDAAGSRVFNDERRALHREIVGSVLKRQIRQGAKAEKKALFLGGLPGAGKTRSLDKIPGLKESDYVTINPDIFKAELARRGHIPKVEGLSPMEASSLAHEESATMAMLLASEARKRNLNIIWDITMNSPGSVSKRLAPLDEQGYRSQAVFVDIPHELSVKRVKRRHQGGWNQARHENALGGEHLGERFVPSGHVAGGKSKLGSSSANRDAFEAVKGQFASSILFNNFNGNENEFPLQEMERRGQFKA